MKKRTKRLLATLLASVMILQQGSTVGVLATEETGELPAETIVTEAPAPETQAPEVQAPAPETQPSETQIQETQASETQMSGTEATETQAPETKAPETQTAEPATEANTPAPETAGAPENVTETPTGAGVQTSGTEETAGTQSETPDAPVVDAGTDVTVETVTETAAGNEPETEAPKTDFLYEDARVKITATAQPEAKLPQDAQIHADLMQPGTPEYQAAAAALEAAYAGQDVVLDYVFYDIYFTAASAGEGRIEPEAGTVAVSMQFKQPELTPETEAAQAADEAAAATTYDVMHIENGKAQEVQSTVQTTEDGSVASVGFTSDSFSPYALVMSVEEQDDVAMIGTMAIDENDGNTGGFNYSTNLGDFLTASDIVFSSNDKEVEQDGKTVLRKNREYNLHLSFKEDKSAGGLQFGNGEVGEQTLEFSLPAGFTFEGITDANPNFSITVKDADGNDISIPSNSFKIEEGKLKVTLNSELGKYADVSFSVDIHAKTTSDLTSGSVSFGDHAQKHVEIDESQNVKVEKSITKYDDDGTAHYSIKVRSEGNNTNIKVKDSIPGNVLKLQQPVTATSNKGTAVKYSKEITYTADRKGFECEIESMDDGEEITFEYTAKVDWDEVTGSITENDRENSVEVSSIDDPDGDKDRKLYDYNEIKYDWVSKTGIYDETNKKITWKVTVNESCKSSAAGLWVYDEIDEGSRDYLSFKKDDKITIKVYDEAGDEVTDYTPNEFILDSDHLLDEEGSYYGWKYQIPEADKDKKYKYVFSCSTDVDTSGLINETEVKNDAEVQGKGETQSPGITIKGEEARIEKSYIPKLSNEDEVTWQVDVYVPVTALDRFVITEDLPHTAYNASDGTYHYVYDSFAEGSLSVKVEPEEQLYYDTPKVTRTQLDYEPYSITSESFTLTFFKDSAKSKEGLNALSNSGDVTQRHITLTFKTKNSDEWVEQARTNDSLRGHKNNVKALVNTKELSDDEEISITPAREKSVTKWSNGSINGIAYYIRLDGVNSDSLTLTDTYSDLLEYYVDSGNPILFEGSDSVYDTAWLGMGAAGEISISDDKTSHTLTINVTKVPKKDDGSYYS